ncbi:unnamed protein product [Strongylus vulgaris]|uniref:WDHD1/CFT4 second beta-propeller domain-containing protein n=1 Tax=Strongylus vulgaris TaxID=40348 RepID=A0A3P7JVB0_STRVU|nr:unnamed protein product [Strongylus vulgaris]
MELYVLIREKMGISFHDVSIHPTIVLDNGVTEYVLADLSDQAVALASKAEEKGEQSELLVIHIASWDSESRRWTADLPLGENALDILVSQELVYLVTEKRNIRVFSLTGTQRHVISHPMIHIASWDSESRRWTAKLPLGENALDVLVSQELVYLVTEKRNIRHTVSIYNVDSRHWYRKKNNVTSVDVPVAKREHLLWLAFTNYGQLVSMDSSYTIRLLTPSGFWLPIFDGSHEVAGKSDAIWPIAVNEGRQKQIRQVLN